MAQLIILLDACRYDYFKKEISSYTKDFILMPIRSWGFSTPEFYKNITGVSDFVLLTANPVVTLSGNDGKWKRVIHAKSLDPNNNLKACLDLLRYENKIVLHLIPPHLPWQGKEGREVFARLVKQLNYPIKQELNKYHDDALPLGIPEKLAYKAVGVEKARRYYRENLRFALDAIFSFYEKLPKPFIITSDHGEALGENGEWGHIDGRADNPILRTVPLAVVY